MEIGTGLDSFSGSCKNLKYLSFKVCGGNWPR
jgi:hypothetical protein